MGLPVGIHTGFEGVGITGAPTASGYPISYLEWHTGLFSNYVTHLISLVSEGVFQRFPGLRLVMIEGGVSWLPALMWRFDKNWKALRRLAPWLDRPPSEVIRPWRGRQPCGRPARCARAQRTAAALAERLGAR